MVRYNVYNASNVSVYREIFIVPFNVVVSKSPQLNPHVWRFFGSKGRVCCNISLDISGVLRICKENLIAAYCTNFCLRSVAAASNISVLYV